MNEKHLLTVDPGKGGTGLAFWNLQEWENEEYILPRFHCSLGYKDEEKYMYMIKKLSMKFHVVKAYIEQASFMEGVKGSMVSRRGDLVTLAEFIGRLVQLLRGEGACVELVPVMKWKGNLPKDVIKRRIQKRFPKCEAKASHDWDAIGIGFFLFDSHKKQRSKS